MNTAICLLAIVGGLVIIFGSVGVLIYLFQELPCRISRVESALERLSERVNNAVR